jgi:hypothetical protein
VPLVWHKGLQDRQSLEAAALLAGKRCKAAATGSIPAEGLSLLSQLHGYTTAFVVFQTR